MARKIVHLEKFPAEPENPLKHVTYDLIRTGLSCIRTDPANYLTSLPRDYAVVRNGPDLGSGEICETTVDGTDFEFQRSAPISS